MAYDKSVVVPLPPDDTFALLTQPERLRRWNSIAARIDVRAGGDYRWTVTPGMSAAGTITEVEPGRRLVFGWGWEGSTIVAPNDSTVTITLEPTHDGTIVRLVHEGLSEEQEVGHTEGWNHYLDRLVAAGETGDAGPDDYHSDGRLDKLDELTAAEATLAIAEYVARHIDAASLGDSTPCREFTIAQVAHHLMGSIASLGGMAGAELTQPTLADVADSEVPIEVQIADLAQPALEAWRRRGLEGEIAMGPMEMPASFFAGILSVEFLVHAWDLAAASGQKLIVDDRLAAYVLELSKRVVSDEMRIPSMFGPAIEIGADAGAMDQLIAFTGRPVGVAAAA
jgi:uncharacterized protein (TIGR03086 family)